MSLRENHHMTYDADPRVDAYIDAVGDAATPITRGASDDFAA